MTPRIAISIINYRTGDLTLQCVQSVLDDIGDLSVQVVVVDNLSEDGSAEQIEDWIAAQDPPVPVTLVRSPTNSGFSGGHNQGISAGDAAFYLELNSDAILRPGFLKTILATAEAAPAKTGFLVPRLEWEDGEGQTNCFRFPGPASEFIRGANSGPVTKLLRNHVVALGTDPDPAQIEWASFACILLRHEMVETLGLMDEGYFLYFEDAEYCLRARRAGWDIQFVPDAIAVHFRGGSGPVKALAKAKKRLPGYYYSSRSRFFYQAHGWPGLIAANLAWHLGRGVAQLRRLLGKPVAPKTEAEQRDIWINARMPLGPRRAPWE